ncbi:MAG: hypothetical protein LIO62_01635 [Clostridiales bacterium]|nr:hypothetical protein [Clostridiales bacterium]
MEYRLGNSKYVKYRGDSREITCPKCQSKVNFGVFSNYDRRLDAHELLNCKTVYFLVCPKCASIFTVDEAKGDSFKKGQKLSITDIDLSTL